MEPFLRANSAQRENIVPFFSGRMELRQPNAILNDGMDVGR
jgi:hypothetical protein